MKRFVYYTINEQYLQKLHVYIFFRKIDTIARQEDIVNFIREKEGIYCSFHLQQLLADCNYTSYGKRITSRRYHKIIRELIIKKNKK